jgi:hypothetical protein
LYSGSYTSPVTHYRCSNTLSLRATATIARRLARLPPPPIFPNPDFSSKTTNRAVH